jgi:thiol:disulfide interchange protein DsbD
MVSGIAPPSNYKEWVQQEGKDVRGDCPHNIPCFYDFKKGLAHAREVDKPVLVDFTGYSCENCRRMEDNVWSEPDILSMLKEDYVLVSLYVDKRKKLPKGEQYVSEVTGEEVTTEGEKWIDFQISCFNHNAQPFYVPLDHQGDKLADPKGYVDAQTYRKFLQKGLKNFEQGTADKKTAVR